MSFFGNKIELKDTPQLDAFSRLRVSQANTIFDSQQEYGLQTSTTWDASANGTFAAASTNGSASSAGNAVGPTNSNTRMTPVTVSTTANHYAVLQSRQYSRYIPGKSHLILMTGMYGFTSGTSARIVLRTSTSGSVSDSNQVEKADWNIDPLDGTGPSGKTLDLTKTQILFIQAQCLGVGRVVVGFDIDGILVPVHQFLNANSLTVPYTLITPAVVIRPILPANDSVNHNAPSGPAAMCSGLLLGVGVSYSVTTPAVVIRPILDTLRSANHNAPSGPAVIPKGSPPDVGRSNSLIAPAVVIRPILWPKVSVNHKAPSGPEQHAY